MFASAVQSSIISLFSSTGSEPLTLFSSSIDEALPSDSFIHFLHDSLSLPLAPGLKNLVKLPTISDTKQQRESSTSQSKRGYELDQTVLHIQSPTIRTTYIQCPPKDVGGAVWTSDHALGIKHPWLHLQVRNLGREWAFEVGVVDHADRAGIIRFSTFQKKPRLKINPKKTNSTPLLLLPLSFPSRSAHLLTPWSTIAVHLPALIPYFSSLLPGDQTEEDENELRQSGPHRTLSRISIPIPSGTYAHMSYVRVYATCRLRRIWFGESGPSQKAPWEFELY